MKHKTGTRKQWLGSSAQARWRRRRSSHGVAGVEVGRGGRLEHDRRPLEGVPGRERVALDDGELAPLAALERVGARAAVRGGGAVRRPRPEAPRGAAGGCARSPARRRSRPRPRTSGRSCARRMRRSGSGRSRRRR